MPQPIAQPKTTRPPTFPEPWAGEWGEDQYGFWQALIYKEIRYVFRWIPAGEFLMGSPIDEPERETWSAKETQHSVMFIDGFWIGETTVTQALWQAIMGKNPSRFNEDLENPVEKVSWDDCQQFIKTLSALLNKADFFLEEVDLDNQLHLRLPFEAEWEYACRAGTKTAFSFGENINTYQFINYDAHFSYDNAKEGGYRGKTVKVRSLPSNDWGLYEMHGNVWEWCEDFYQKDLGSDPVVNPIGAEAGSERVIRGGGWGSYGGRVRSAMRDDNSADDHGNDIGLRLVVGQSKTSLQNKKAVN